MTPKWMSQLVSARQSQEDAAAQRLAFARRAQTRARNRAESELSRLDTLAEIHEATTSHAFVAAAVSLQSVAATYAAAMGELGRADAWVEARQNELAAAAVSRLTAEQLRDNARAQADAVRARAAAYAMDEAAAVSHRRREEEVS